MATLVDSFDQTDILTSREINVPDFEQFGPYSESFRNIESNSFMTRSERAEILNVKTRSWEVFMRAKLDEVAIENPELSLDLQKARAEYFANMNLGDKSLGKLVQKYADSYVKNKEYDYAVIREQGFLHRRVAVHKPEEANLIHARYLEDLQNLAIKYGFNNLPADALKHAGFVESRAKDVYTLGSFYSSKLKTSGFFDSMGIFITKPYPNQSEKIKTYAKKNRGADFSYYGRMRSKTEDLVEEMNFNREYARARSNSERARNAKTNQNAGKASSDQTKQESSNTSQQQSEQEQQSQNQERQESRPGTVPAQDMAKYYQALGLQPGASKAEVKAAYKKLAKENHPDIVGNSSNDRMVEINNAKDAINDALN
jgi:DnaJ-domain-containing protein 1